MFCLFLGACSTSLFLFFFNDTATTEIYTLSLHDALPIFLASFGLIFLIIPSMTTGFFEQLDFFGNLRSEEHTSELQSLRHLVCRLLLEKKKNECSSPNMIITTRETNRLKTRSNGKCRTHG